MDTIWDSIEWEWSNHPQPDENAISLATDLLEMAKKGGVFPDFAGSGWYPSVRLFWQNGRVEVEVFADRLELYFLPGQHEGKEFSISEFEITSFRTLQTVVERINDLDVKTHL